MSAPPSGPVFHERIPLPNSNVTLRFERVEDLDPPALNELIELLRLAFNGGPSWFGLTADPVDHLRWKAIDRPGGAVVELTELDGRLVGMRLEGAARFMVRGRATGARNGSDVAIHPDYQGMGISSARVQYRERVGESPGVDFEFAVGTHPASPLRRPEGTRSIIVANHIDSLVRPLHPWQLVAARLRRRPVQAGTSRTATSLRAQARARRLPLPSRDEAIRALRLTKTLALDVSGRRRTSWPVRSLARFDARADDLWLEAAGAFDLIQVRDQTYLNWRFRDARGGRFVIRVVDEGARLLGYSALRLTPDSAVLADLLVLPRRDDIVYALLQDATFVAATRGLAHIRTRLSRHHPYRAALEANGYVAYPTDQRVALAPASLDSEVAAIASDPQARIHLTIADTDHV